MGTLLKRESEYFRDYFRSTGRWELICLLCAVITAVRAFHTRPLLHAVFISVVEALLFRICVTDIRHRKIYNRDMLAFLVLSLISLRINVAYAALSSRLLAVLGVAFSLFVSIFIVEVLGGAGQCIGGGDIKMLIIMAFLLGGAVLPAVFVASWLALIFSIALFFRDRSVSSRRSICFGPFLAAGITCVFLF